jgi:hypothetical protein
MYKISNNKLLFLFTNLDIKINNIISILLPNYINIHVFLIYIKILSYNTYIINIEILLIKNTEYL